jgi:hypothetical protein
MSYKYEQPHRVYVDSLPGIVETPEISCALCLSYLSDDMWVKVVRREIGVASRRTIIRHLALIQTFKNPLVHFIVCDHELRKRGLECCSILEATSQNNPMSLKDFVARERARDRINTSGDSLPHNVGYISLLQTMMVE